MALNSRHGWLIAYDIANPRRLQRLHRFLVREAVPVQYSVFYYEGNTAAMGRLMAEVEKRINPKQDDVRAYQLPTNPRIDTIGRGAGPEGISLFSSTTPQFGALLSPAEK